MNKKFFIGLFVISLIVFAGGCGGSSNSLVTSTTDVNTALKGAWTSSTNGTAKILNINTDIDELDTWIDAFGELPSELLDQYKKEQEKKTAASVNAPVTSAMIFFDECNIEESSGTTKLTAIVILSGDSLFLPIFYNGVAISTQRNNTNEWTATTPDGGTLSINMTSEEKINLSGKVHYLNYDCEFSTVIDKNLPNAIDPKTILNGTWKLSSTQGGGYLAVNSNISAAIIPKAVSMYFNNTTQESSTLLKSSLTSFYSLHMKTSDTGNNESSVLRTINQTSDETFTQIYDNVYKFTEANSEGIVFVENTDEIFVFMTENVDNAWQTCMFLPLKKITFDIEAAMNKNWTAFDGGGYIKLGNINNPDNNQEIEFIKSLDTFSFTLQNANLNFSGVTINDDSITATVNINTSFLITNKILDALLEFLGITPEPINISDTWQVTMTNSGNFLSFVDDDDTIYNLSFISDTETFLSITSKKEVSGEGNFILRFSAN